MGVTYRGCAQEKWQIESMYQSQEGECSNNKDNYPLPITEYLFEQVAKKEVYSFWMGSQDTTKYPYIPMTNIKPPLLLSLAFLSIKSCHSA